MLRHLLIYRETGNDPGVYPAERKWLSVTPFLSVFYVYHVFRSRIAPLATRFPSCCSFRLHGHAGWHIAAPPDLVYVEFFCKALV
jgi:hypothetical protein